MSGTDPVRDGIPCMLMRGGTSKGAYFLREDLPADEDERDDLLLRIMGSPDPRQIDGIGGAHPLTSKVAIVEPSTDDGADVDYLFLQIGVDAATVSDAQTCGNLLAGVGPFAVERGLIAPPAGEADVRIRLVNTGDVAHARFAIADGRPVYAGDAVIDGVPGAACPIDLGVGRTATALLPTGSASDEVAGRTATLVDNGMPVVVLDGRELGLDGTEDPAALEADADVVAAVETVRRAAGPLFGLGDVTTQSVPKIALAFPPRDGGSLATRIFIPARVHTSIGVLMAASVAAAALIPGTVAAEIATLAPSDGSGTERTVDLEHPSGTFPARVEVQRRDDGTWGGASLTLRTARKLFDGRVFPRPGAAST